MIFPLLSLLLPLSLWSSSAEALVNVKVERQIDVISLAVKTTLAINFKGVGKTYQFVLPKDVSEGLADITFRHRDQLLPSDQLASQKCPEKHVCWNIHVNDKRQFTATYSTISQLKPHPSKDVALEDPLKLKLVTSQYYPSVYETQEETTFFRYPILDLLDYFHVVGSWRRARFWRCIARMPTSKRAPVDPILIRAIPRTLTFGPNSTSRPSSLAPWSSQPGHRTLWFCRGSAKCW
jgi:hypothetical protein